MRNLFSKFVFVAHTESTPWVRLITWFSGVMLAAMLAFVRVATDAEFAFASAMVLPVFAVAWIVGKRAGVWYSVLAAVVWLAADMLVGRHYSAPWIPFANGFTRFFIYAFVAYLAASLHEVLIREYEMARHDALTGLLNRRAFFKAGTAETLRAQRYGHPVTVVFLDLDDFKQLNDARGHEVGDRALIAVGHALSNLLRKSDIIARLGGDEFAIVLPETSFSAASETTKKISSTLNRALAEYRPVSVSIGMSWYEKVDKPFEAMVGAADSLMYDIKAEGKHGVRCRQFFANVPEGEVTGAARSIGTS